MWRGAVTMPRARSIKPGFFKNEGLADLHPQARLLFMGLWMLADREGRLEDRPKRIKAELFPYERADVDALLQSLADSTEKFIIRYKVDGEGYIQITNWARHQNPHHMEPASVIPAPAGLMNRYHHSPISPKQRARIYLRDGNKCVFCGAKEGLQIDHIILVSQGGTSNDDNLRTLCAQCNNKRSKACSTQDLSQSNPADSGLLTPSSLTPDSLNPIPDCMGADDAFERIWNAYPAKGRARRIQCEQIFSTLIGRANGDAAQLVEEILAPLAVGGKWVNSKQWGKNEGQFIFGLADYLTQQRWREEPEQKGEWD